ncbi:hypothetical protein CDAR_197641 [Caerostris darwini]|uniref:Uncharacterized protein n=1 Tax=Caerostris darwini TaxID=1538125 RepID=A0AAV4RRQ0_9ARAC|nr:hypothetical protein CDAR_197641 [Caerostris darwini]
MESKDLYSFVCTGCISLLQLHLLSKIQAAPQVVIKHEQTVAVVYYRISRNGRAHTNAIRTSLSHIIHSTVQMTNFVKSEFQTPITALSWKVLWFSEEVADNFAVVSFMLGKSHNTMCSL